MAGINTYIKEYGDKTFNEEKFNEIDNVILSSVVYLNFDGIVPKNKKSISLCEAGNIFLYKYNYFDVSKLGIAQKVSYKILKQIVNTKRYKDIQMYNYKYIGDTDTQFGAVCFKVKKKFIYVAFEGTDNLLSGWKEDFQMAYEFPVPSQKLAVKYLNENIKQFDKNIIVGGHSKGGNLALYGAMYAKEETKKKIIKIYNFDGPGFYDKKIYETEEFKNASKKLFSITSRVSVVSMLLYKIPGVRFIEVRSVSVLTHDAFNWSVDVDKCKFKFVEKNSNLSRWLDAASDQYMEETTPFGRKNIVEITFKILKESPTMSLVDVVHHPILYIKRFRVRHKALSKDENNILENEIKKIRKILKISFKNSIIGKNNDIENNNKLLKGDKDE